MAVALESSAATGATLSHADAIDLCSRAAVVMAGQPGWKMPAEAGT